MKIIVIGDTHGHDSWKQIVENEDYDLVIFLGDYVDSFSVRPEIIADNLRDILEFKRQNPDKVILIWGNHDHSYAFNEECSGHNKLGAMLYNPLFDQALREGLFNIIYVYDDIIFSHAGVSEYWLKHVANVNDINEIDFEHLDIRKLDWNSKTGNDGYGDTISQSPIWIRPYSLNMSKVNGYRQIVGHTWNKQPVKKNDVWYNDMMPNYYITVTDGDIKFTENPYVKKKKEIYTGSHDISHCAGEYCNCKKNCTRYIAHLDAKKRGFKYVTYLIINPDNIDETGKCTAYWEYKKEEI